MRVRVRVKVRGYALEVKVRVWAPMTRVSRWYAALTLGPNPSPNL